MTDAAWFSHELCNFHDPGTAAGYLPAGHLLEPLRGFGADPDMRRAEALVTVSGVMDRFTRVTPRPATTQEILAVHSARLLDRIDRLSAQGHGDAGSYAPVGFHSAQAARLAAGAAVQACEDVLAGRTERVYCLVRPPGHHAEPDAAMALCLLNNVAIGVRAAQRAGAGRIMVLDWDVHHGNGIQAVFDQDPDVLYVSIHQAGLFPPASGSVMEIGTGPGEGFTINAPLPAGSGLGAYEAVMARVVEPAAAAFRPALVVVAAGVDASAHDPMGRMMLTSSAFHHLTARTVKLAERLGHGRLVLVHEGGYSAWYQPMCVLATASAMVGLPSPPDPFDTSLAHLPGQELQPHQERVVHHLERHHPRLRTKEHA